MNCAAVGLVIRRLSEQPAQFGDNLVVSRVVLESEDLTQLLRELLARRLVIVWIVSGLFRVATM